MTGVQTCALPIYWKTAKQQVESLTDVIRCLLQEGLRPEDLVILSPHTFADSTAGRLSFSDHRHGTVVARELRDSAPASRSQTALGFATIQAFKGMESPGIILCDIERVETEEPQALLYVGMSRARSYLVMMVHESVKTSISQALLKKLAKDWQS